MKASLISGGIDSLFASILYLERRKGPPLGICGIFTEKIWKLRNNIKQVYTSLGIKVVFFDLVEEFREKIILPFVRSYVKGLTPNPCCICNSTMKFGTLYSLAREREGARGCISGHYACIKYRRDGVYLYKGMDGKKEQSYFLSLLSKKQLGEIELPLCDWDKKNVKKEIHARGITVPISRESQEICFIEGDYRDLIRSLLPSVPPPGPIVGVWGERLGQHQGLYAYTIGQRRGLKIPYREPLYVIAKDIKENTLIVGTRRDLLKKSCMVRELNILESRNLWPEEVFVKYNYNMPFKRANTHFHAENRVEVKFDQEIPSPSPGQICCFYSREGKVLGGGIIE